MLTAIKPIVLRVCELLGLFHVSAWAFRKRLSILCYHGFEVLDECAFRPQLFISGKTFEERLRYIAESGFVVFSLTEALKLLRSGSLPKRSLVITIDDGFKSTFLVASPLLAKFQLPATVYVTTYYVDKQVPIFRLAVQYVFWKAAGQGLDLLNLRLQSGVIASTSVFDDANQAMWALIEQGEALGSEDERQQLLTSLAQVMNVDLSQLRDGHLLSLLSAEEIRILHSRGIDIQLHTHRHKFPITDRKTASLEIEENRSRLRDAIGVTPQHFCYPSGIFADCQWQWLQALGIASATTCIPGLNGRDTPIYGLKRFLDSESIEFIEFKAELSGFNEFLRFFRKVFNAGQTKIVRAAN